MAPLFLVCAVLGTTVLVLQFLLGLVGLGGDAWGLDLPHDFGHAGGVDHDFGDHDLGDHNLGGAEHDVAGHEASAIDHADTGPTAHGSTWLFQVITFRTVVAAMAFFGLAGLAAQAADYSDFTSLAIALAAGIAAMYAVFAMLRAMRSLRADGTVRIERAVGQQAAVYLHIPAQQKGVGKIQINLQNRTMEYLATTLGDSIPCGATVVVTKIISPDTVQVQVI
jgi:hypothetical protein